MENNKSTNIDNSKNNNFKAVVKKLSKRYFIDAFSGMAQGLFVTLIAGTIFEQIGKLIGAETGFGAIMILVANYAKMLMGAGIGAGIAKQLKAPNLVIYGSMVAGLIGAFLPDSAYKIFTNPDAVFSVSALAGTGVLKLGLPGNPIGSYVAALLACELGNLVSGKTKVDILVVPLVILITCILSIFIAIPAIWLIDLIARFIEISVTAQPFIMGIIISAVMGILLTMPTSSAAIWISIATAYPNSDAMLLAGGAAVVGCAAQMVGFAVMSFKENKWGGLIAQGLGTSMLQIPNIMKKPIIFVPPIIASIVVGPLATCLFKLRCDATGGGMGTSGLVGVFGVVNASSGVIPSWQMWIGIILLMFVLPGLISWGVAEIFRKKGLIKEDYLKLDI